MRTIRTPTHQLIWNIDSHFQFPSSYNTDQLPYSAERYAMWKTWEAKAKTDPQAAERVRNELYRPPYELL